MSESLHVNMSYSGSVVLKEKKNQWPRQIFAILWLSPLWRGSGPLFEQFKIPFTQRWFVPSLIEIGLLVLGKIFFFDINTNEYGFPHCGPSGPRGPWREQFWIYIISESFQVNIPYSSWVVLEKKIFKWPHPIFVITSPLKRTWSFIWTI
jgi:hypothetical protein